MLNDLLLVFVLILINGLFAMSEIAVVSSRRARLFQLAEAGSGGARAAMQLAAEPTRFLSSIQVGITCIGILNGAIGEAAVAGRLRVALAPLPLVGPFADELAMAVMVVGLTYVSLIVGELVPKRLALTHPERVASLVARPMQVVAAAGRPLINLLSVSTESVLRLLRVRRVAQPAVTVEEIKVLMEQGAAEGVFERSEHEMVSNVLSLDHRQVRSILTPRADVVFLDVRDTPETTRARLRDDLHAVVPLCDGGLDRVLGVVRLPRLLGQLAGGGDWSLRPLAEPALFVPESMPLDALLEEFKRTHLSIALVVDEHGAVEGVVSLTDVTSAIVGALPFGPGGAGAIVRRDDGSWLMDGGVDLDVAAEVIGAEAVSTADEGQPVRTLGGLAMLALQRVPRTGDVFERGGVRFEVVDMDANRVDRLLVSRLPAAMGNGPGRADA
ncbi:MAG: hemolysin family protein [Vicinamibacterales bacterium]